MSYATGEAAILTLIQGLSAYDSSNSARQDWKILHSGSAAYNAVIRPGTMIPERISATMFNDRWTTVIEIWRRYIDDDRPVSLQGDVATVVSHLRRYRTLNSASGVIYAEIAGVDEMQEVTLNNGSLWARWNVNLEWIDESTITYAD